MKEKHEKKKGPINKKHEVFPTESVLKKVKSSKKKVKKRWNKSSFCNFS